jgi:hypothetical protein
MYISCEGEIAPVPRDYAIKAYRRRGGKPPLINLVHFIANGRLKS